jgi:1-phosphatidylinositol-3-phosphate 5-kinase
MGFSNYIRLKKKSPFRENISSEIFEDKGDKNQVKKIKVERKGRKRRTFSKRSSSLLKLGSTPSKVVAPFTTFFKDLNIKQSASNDNDAFSTMELNSTCVEHLKEISKQILAEAGLEEWQSVVYKLLLHITRNLNSDIRLGDEKDIRHYIKIKRIPGGLPSHSHYVSGVVFTKNVCHKKMQGPKENPRIVLLSFALEYQRVENEFISLGVLLAQEKEHLKNLVCRVVALNPDIVLVEKAVSRLALEFLLEAGITVAYGVKSSVMETIARCTMADIISGIDQLTLDPKLGTCKNFRLQTYHHEDIPDIRKTYSNFLG